MHEMYSSVLLFHSWFRWLVLLAGLLALLEGGQTIAELKEAIIASYRFDTVTTAAPV